MSCPAALPDLFRTPSSGALLLQLQSRVPGCERSPRQYKIPGFPLDKLRENPWRSGTSAGLFHNFSALRHASSGISPPRACLFPRMTFVSAIFRHRPGAFSPLVAMRFCVAAAFVTAFFLAPPFGSARDPAAHWPDRRSPPRWGCCACGAAGPPARGPDRAWPWTSPCGPSTRRRTGCRPRT